MQCEYDVVQNYLGKFGYISRLWVLILVIIELFLLFGE